MDVCQVLENVKEASSACRMYLGAPIKTSSVADVDRSAKREGQEASKQGSLHQQNVPAVRDYNCPVLKLLLI